VETPDVVGADLDEVADRILAVDRWPRCWRPTGVTPRVLLQPERIPRGQARETASQGGRGRGSD
jgi:hypothetical protein